MRYAKVLSAVAIVMGAAAALVGAQTPAASSSKLEVVEIIGCLAEDPKGTWVVTNATEPVASRNPYTNEAAIKEAEAKPLGKARFVLIAVSMFNPDSHRAHKVAVKGLLIKDAKGDRLNVTSLQTASTTCS